MSEVKSVSFRAREIIPPERVHLFAPGDILAEGDTGRSDRRRVFFRDYAYQPSTITAPGIDSLQIVIYRQGSTRMRRYCGEGWKEQPVGPGVMSIMGAGRASDWQWLDPLRVSHLYLSRELMADTAAWAFERDYRKLESFEEVRLEDQKLLLLAEALAAELRAPSDGGNLLIDSVASGLSLHLIRRYHRYSKAIQEVGPHLRLSPFQRTRALEFIDTHISRNFKLAELAKAASLSEYQLLRCFKNTFGDSPHQYVMNKRVKLAIERICRTDTALAEIAFDTGFSDQAHMTRVVRKMTGLTPGALRAKS